MMLITGPSTITITFVPSSVVGLIVGVGVVVVAGLGVSVVAGSGGTRFTMTTVCATMILLSASPLTFTVEPTTIWLSIAIWLTSTVSPATITLFPIIWFTTLVISNDAPCKLVLV